MKVAGLLVLVSVVFLCSCSLTNQSHPETPAFSVTLVPLYVGDFKLAMIPSDAIIDLKDDSVGQRLSQLAEEGRLFIFYGESSSPTPLPEEGYRAARAEAFVKISQFVELRVQSVEWKLSAAISTVSLPSNLMTMTESLVKRAIQISSNTQFSGARDIVRYRLDRPGELDRYVVIVLFDPETLMASLKMSEEYLHIKEVSEAAGTNGRIFFEELNRALEEAFKSL